MDDAPVKPRQISVQPSLPIEKMSPNDRPTDLAGLRAEIDRIDAAMHRLLMERGEIIERLIKTKKTAESGSAFRPAREADMMRRLVERHGGMLPLDTVEGIWRVIIATFTYVQAPFRVHADFSSGESAMRDSERFHFGFTVPIVPHLGAAGVVAAVAASRGDLGLVPVTASAADGAWWTALEGDDAPKIIARLPFVEREDHPAALPVFAIARPHPDAIVTDVQMYSIRVAGWGARRRPGARQPRRNRGGPRPRLRRRRAARVDPPRHDARRGDPRPRRGRRLGAQRGPRRQPRNPL